MTLLEELVAVNTKRYALRVQQALLGSPYGEHLTVLMKSMSAMDAFDGTNVDMHGDQQLTAIVLHANDSWDKHRIDEFGADGFRTIILSDGSIYWSSVLEPKKFAVMQNASSGEFEKTAKHILNTFVLTTLPSNFSTSYSWRLATERLDQVAFASKDETVFWRALKQLKTPELMVGSEVLALGDKNARILKVKGFTHSRNFSKNNDKLSSLQDLLTAHNVKAIKALIDKNGPLKLVCADPSSGKDHSLIMNGPVLAWRDVDAKYKLYGLARL